MKRVHIVGTSPRTGTTLLAEALQVGCNIDNHTHHETRLYSRPKEKSHIFLTKAPRDIMVVGPSLKVDQIFMFSV